MCVNFTLVAFPLTPCFFPSSMPTDKALMEKTSNTKTLPPMTKSASLPAVGGAAPLPAAIPKMKKMSVEDQAAFMIISEHVHPQLRLSYPATNKTLSGLTAYVVNTLMAAPSIQEGLVEFFGDTEMLQHAVNNVGAVAEAVDYPGNLHLVVPYIPVDDKIVAFQITCVVEYLITELLALAGGIVMKNKDQPEFKNAKPEVYDEFPKIK